MKIISVNVGLPRLLRWKGEAFETGIFKDPVAGRIVLRATNLEGDRQADLSVHGGPNKAVYAYPMEHYALWRAELREAALASKLSPGAFGENFTTEGLPETDACIGDRYGIGSAIVKVTTPRLPCFKLAAQFERDSIIEEFARTGRCGFYFAVLQEGEVGAGDEFKRLGREDPTLTVAEANALYLGRSPNRATLERSLHVTSLPGSWRERFRARLQDIDRNQGRR